MPDNIRQLFAQLDAEPDAAFVASLRNLMMENVMRPAATASGSPTSEESTIMTITEDRLGTPSRRRAGLAMTGIAAAAAVIVTGVIIISRDDEKSAAPTATTTQESTTTVAAPATTVATFEALPILTIPASAPVAAPAALAPGTALVDDAILQVKFDGFNLWTTGRDISTLLRIDTTTGQVAETLNLPAAASADWLEANQGYLYVMTNLGVVIVNGQTEEMTAPRAFSSGSQILSIGFTTNAAWLFRTNGDGTNKLERWDLGLNAMALSVDLEAGPPAGMAGVGDQLYLGTEGRGVLHFDNDGNLVNTIADIGYTFDMMATESGTALWVADYDSGEVIRIDPATDQIVARIRAAGVNAHSVWATDTSVWVTTWSAGNVNVIDPVTNTMTAQLRAGQGPMTLSLANGVIWVAGEGYLNSFVPA